MGTQKRLIAYAYARVSTRTQAKDGNSLEGKRSALLSAYPTSLFYQEAYTGMTTDLPELSKILEKNKKGRYAGGDKTCDTSVQDGTTAKIVWIFEVDDPEAEVTVEVKDL